MLRLIAVILIAIIPALPAAAYAQTAQEILQEVVRMDLSRKSTVQNYIVNQCTMGQGMLLYYEKSQAVLANGETVDTFRLVPPNEIAERQNNGATLTPNELELYASNLELLGDTLSQEIEQSGMPAHLLMSPASYDEPWASPDPRVMTGSMAMFLRAAAAAEQDRQLNGVDTDVASSQQQFEQMIGSAELVGTESVEGRPAFHIRTDDVDYTQVANGGEEFEVNSVSVWIDQDNYVPLRLLMNGSATMEGEAREMFIEMLSLDYQQIGPLYESTRQVMRMGGMLTPEQEIQMEEAREQMAQMKQQLAGLTGPEKQMLQNMLGPQMQMMENLVNNGTIEVQTLIPRIRVNAGLPDQVEMASAVSDTAPCASTGNQFGASPTGFAPPGVSDGGVASGSAGIPTGNGGAPGSSGSSTPVQPDTAAVQAAQQECLQEKIAAVQESRPRRRGLGGLLGGVGQAVSQIGNLDIGGLAGGLFGPGASDEDIEERARELGLSEQDINECRAARPEPTAAPALDF
ncbi:MAG: outer membrane lipoprotein-sorting protein [Gammaproteobacteria bacterium]|nr:outer membrane lipoprotein-sorting protein [Gammaproteobacteria bacterium]